MKTRFDLFLAAMAVLFPSTLPAQDGEAPARDFQVRLVSWGRSVHDLPIYLRNGGDFTELSLRTNRRSQPVELITSGPMELYTDGEDAEGNPVKVPIGATTLPAELDRPLLILFDTGREGAERFRLVPIEDSDRVFPFGTYRVFNFTNVPLAFQLEADTEMVAPGRTALVETADNERKNVAVRIVARVEGGPRILKQSYWRHQPDQRMLVFVLRTDDPDRPDFILRTIAERRATYLHHYGKE